jgi:dimethylamine monooxygenase subunit A
MTPLHARLPVASWTDPRTRRLPGTLPLDMADWLSVDEAYAAQMALRDRLIAERETEVHAILPQAEAAAAEVYAIVLPRLPGLGFVLSEGEALRPDGLRIPLNPARPLLTLGRLLQEDICLMQPDGVGEHMLTGAILCFPAGWRLEEKLGRALMRVHLPVAKYTEDVGRRVQRLMDAIRPETPMWRANAHRSRAPLFNPLSEVANRVRVDDDKPWIRCERQCLIRLPETQAVVFTIRTYVVRKEDLTDDQAAALAEFPIHQSA